MKTIFVSIKLIYAATWKENISVTEFLFDKKKIKNGIMFYFNWNRNFNFRFHNEDLNNKIKVKQKNVPPIMTMLLKYSQVPTC